MASTCFLRGRMPSLLRTLPKNSTSLAKYVPFKTLMRRPESYNLERTSWISRRWSAGSFDSVLMMMSSM